ncbi:MAG: MarR family transcriptional regulator [Alicyclobacillaceae bacterium]|nr:MarR family transcriptional regulator [Alicyclobacillaceae bacterium]
MADHGMDEHVRQLDELMVRLQRVMHRRANMGTMGLTATQVFILGFLDKHGQAKASDVARIAGLSPGAVTQVCDELVRLGFVARSRSNKDRRVVHISITEAGRDKLESIRRSRSKQLADFLRQLGDDDAQAFLRLVGRLVEVAEREYIES